MPTQSTTYNTRLTDETLEKRFRDTFRSQGGAELVDDLYASGVIVPIVDFTAAAEGSFLRNDLQTAWDFTTGANQINNTTTSLATNAGFWRVQGVVACNDLDTSIAFLRAAIQITDGVSTKQVWGFSSAIGTGNAGALTDTFDFVVFLRSGDTLQGRSTGSQSTLDVAYRQIATVSGDFINPSGFVAS